MVVKNIVPMMQIYDSQKYEYVTDMSLGQDMSHHSFVLGTRNKETVFLQPQLLSNTYQSHWLF
jgi:hypothetical protein